jgi:uncharacterized protein
VAKRPKFKKFFGSNDLPDLLDQLTPVVEFVAVMTRVDICRDPKDNFLLSLALDGQATVLITGDQDLLSLSKIGRTKIMTITAFEASL